MRPFDIAPFALPNCPPGEIRFEEPRDIATVVVSFRGRAPGRIGVSYLQKVWPGTRIEEHSDADNPCKFGWLASDDWFNPAWRKAATRVQRVDSSTLSMTFRGLAAEFPDVAAYDVAFRRTLGLRIEVPPSAAVRSARVGTVSPPARTRLRVLLDAGARTPGEEIRLSGYNALVGKVAGGAGVAARGNVVRMTGRGRSPRSFELDVAHMLPAHRYCHDEAQITFETGDDAFTISLDSLLREGAIWYAERGVFVTRADSAMTFAEYRRASEGRKTIRQLVTARPEQTVAGAYNGQPRPHAVAASFGCKHARQRFWLEPNGDLVLNKSAVCWFEPTAPDLVGRDTPRFANDASGRLFFGLERWYVTARFPDPAPVPVYHLHARYGSVLVEQTSLAVPLERSILKGEGPCDETIVALVRFRFRNAGTSAERAFLRLAYSQKSQRSLNPLTGRTDQDDYLLPMSERDEVVLDGARLSTLRGGAPVFRLAYAGAMEAAAAGREAVFTKSLAPGEECEIVLKVPFIVADRPEELAALDGLDFEAAYREVRQYWQRTGADGCQLAVPQPHMTALHAAHLTHVRFSDFPMPDGSGLINTSVGSSTYGNYSNESCMIAQELDQRGLHEEVRRRLELWIRYQGTAEQPGNFTDYEGMFYGAGGYECGNYNQHHGWVLWRLAEHYFLTRDRAWLAKVSLAMLAGADWVARQRRGTMNELPHSRGWERGFLPAGSLEDVTDFHYWLSTNALTWRGVEWAARALEDAGHAEAARVRCEADAYKADLLRGFETMRKHSPLIRLRDGRWVPHYPSRLYCRGRDQGWIREVLEGAVYLLISGLYEPGSKAAAWILDDFQDNLYIRPPYGYAIYDEESNWFDRSGLSFQPNLLAGLVPHLDRDEPEMFLWMFFNAWCACYREEIGAMVEHPWPVLGYSNSAHPKTSDEANAMMWLRSMFVYSREGLLHLGRAVPRAWFREGPMRVGPAVTPFGNVSVAFGAEAGGKALTAEATLPEDRPPTKILIRFRHPDSSPLRSVQVNGRAWKAFDPVKGDVDVTGLTGSVSVQARY